MMDTQRLPPVKGGPLVTARSCERMLPPSMKGFSVSRRQRSARMTGYFHSESREEVQSNAITIGTHVVTGLVSSEQISPTRRLKLFFRRVSLRMGRVGWASGSSGLAGKGPDTFLMPGPSIDGTNQCWLRARPTARCRPRVRRPDGLGRESHPRRNSPCARSHRTALPARPPRPNQGRPGQYPGSWVR